MPGVNASGEGEWQDERDEDIIPNDICAEGRPRRVWHPSEEEERPDTNDELVYDDKVYEMIHEFQTKSPCKTFDILLDNFGNNRQIFPHSMYLVAGTQAEKNGIAMIKLQDLEKTVASKYIEECSDLASGQPKVTSAVIPHPGVINRIRCKRTPGIPFAATWSNQGQVHIWDLTAALAAVDDKEEMNDFVKSRKDQTPIFTFSHACEGKGLDWHPSKRPILASADNDHKIHVWSPSDDGTWSVSPAYDAHNGSIEDIKWADKGYTFASCSTDKSICFWDTRIEPAHAMFLKIEDAHSSDVNVVSWHMREPYISSAGDDEMLNVWDVRKLKRTNTEPVTEFIHYFGAITSLEWHHTRPVFAAGTKSNQVVVWDISQDSDVEPHDDDIIPELLFVHQSQKDVSEVHWHPQIPGVVLSSALNGLNVYKQSDF